MGADEAIIAVRNIQAGLQRIAEDVTVTAGNDLLAMSQERIQTTGKKASGSSLAQYTDAYLKTKKNHPGIKGVIAKGSNRYSGVVDYTLTGRMWASINVMTVVSSPETIEVVISSSTEEGRTKLRAMAKRDNHNPLAPSKEERAILIDTARQEYSRRIKQLFRA